MSRQVVNNWVTGRAKIPQEALSTLQSLGYSGPSDQRDKDLKPVTAADLAELRGWMSAHFEQAAQEREALAEILRAMIEELGLSKSAPLGKKRPGQ